MKIIVIGGGPGGYVAALKAAILGAETVLIEKDSLGGTCLNRGCIPTKALLSSADVKHSIDVSSIFGIESSYVTVDYESIYNRKQAIVRQLVGGVGFLCRKRGVQIVSGKGRLIDGKTVEVTAADGSITTISGDYIILATGSEPAVPGTIPYDGRIVITSDELLELQKVPEKLLIIGGGVIGCEFGCFYNAMGSEVTIVEMQPDILPNEDSDVSAVLLKKMKKNGINVLTGHSVDRIQINGEQAEVFVSGDEQFTVDKVLVSIGGKAVTADMGIEEAGIALEKGKVVVDETMQSSVDTVYAIGDIVNTAALAHVASREGIVAVENILGRNSKASYRAVPRCVYTSPEIACVGMTEKECGEKGIEYCKGQFGFSALGKAMVLNENEGFVKVLADENGVLIGASIVGPHATDMISELGVAVQQGLTDEQVGEVIHPHPTLSEAILEAIHDIRKESVHSF